MSFDGQPLEEGTELLALVVKDSQQKGFFIRVVDPEVRGLAAAQTLFLPNATRDKDNACFSSSSIN